MWRCPRRVSTVVCVHEPHCQPPDCSGHGTCVDGRCECTSRFWRGAACNELDCGPSNCSQHGLCTESEWGAHKEGGALVGPQFSHARPASALTWPPWSFAAGCHCDAGWTGSNCSEGECSSGLQKLLERVALRHRAVTMPSLLTWKSPSEPLLTSHANKSLYVLPEFAEKFPPSRRLDFSTVYSIPKNNSKKQDVVRPQP